MTIVEKFEQNINQVNSDFQAIRSKLIECGVAVPEGTKTAEYAEKVGQLYEAAEENKWWDNYQQNGTRTDYSMAFAGVYWTTETFQPKYDIKPVGRDSTYMMFRGGIQGDLAALLNKLGITLDFSGATEYQLSTFAQSHLTRIGKLDFSNVLQLQDTFSSSRNLQTIDELCVSSRTKFITMFTGCTKLVNLTISGAIGNDFSIFPCTELSKASITSIINALQASVSYGSVSFSKTAVDNAFKDGDTLGSLSDEWKQLIGTKPKWTVTLL